MLCTSSAHQPYHSDQGSLRLRQVLSGDLQRQEVVVPSLLLGHHTPSVGPDLPLGYPLVLIGEEMTHRDLPPSQHTLTPHNTRGRDFIICDVIISPRALTFLIICVISVFKVPKSHRAT